MSEDQMSEDPFDGCICGLGHYDYVTPEACPVHGQANADD